MSRPNNARVTPVTPASRSSNTERLETRDTRREGYVSSPSETSSAAAHFEPTPQEVAVWWESLSPLRSKAETGTAVRRFRAYARTLDTELLWYALGEVAAEGLPAHYFTEKIARERIARIREVRRDMEKREETVFATRVDRGLRSIASILGSAA